MNKRRYLFTSESVTEGHPDKVADQISDAILDALLAQDRTSRVGCETLVTTGLAMIAGEISTTAQVHYPDIVRETIKEIGYNHHSMGFDWETCAVMTSIDRQSPDIAQGVDEGTGLFSEQGAGDQGLMFGYATDESAELMPLPILFAHQLTRQLAEVRKAKTLPYLRPDGKSQVTVRYENGAPAQIDTVVISTQHTPEVSHDTLQDDVIRHVIRLVLPEDMLSTETRFLINPTGRFVLGGPHADCGLTGRKIIADTYGGMGSHGGGAFSGKDPTKVDRSASYMARYVAKNVVASGAARRCEVQIAYAIGYPDPVSLLINTFGTHQVDPEAIETAIREIFPLKPRTIIEQLDLRRPIYKKTAAYGHFGRNEPSFTWERLDRVDPLRHLLNLA
ncbi:MAG: methionine adenosyltransferase [Deltaproteobacteria bacterium]|nr:methionine adenosyltransferase [Deltaproteobacteria bacterium]